MSDQPAVSAYIIPAAPANAAVRLYGLSPSERLQRMGVKQKLPVVRSLEAVPAGHSVVVLRGDGVYDDGVLAGLRVHSGVYLTDSEGNRLAAHVTQTEVGQTIAWLQGGEGSAGTQTVLPEAISDGYNRSLRKREIPFATIVTSGNANAIEWRLFKASYKGVTDFVTKHVWPVPAFWVTKFCANVGLSPNMVTTVGAVLVLLAFKWFYIGQFALGLIAGWVMTFLDTVDGKLARCTLTSSKFGNIFDHGIDLVHPPFWYLAWGLGLTAAGYPLPPGMLETCLWIIFVCYVVGRLCEGYFIRRFGFHLHVWRPFDSLFRQVVARRNPNMVILTISLLMGRPDVGFVAITAWTAIGLLTHVVQMIQAHVAHRKQPITSWLA